jgi:hypothetical protein
MLCMCGYRWTVRRTYLKRWFLAKKKKEWKKQPKNADLKLQVHTFRFANASISSRKAAAAEDVGPHRRRKLQGIDWFSAVI